LQVRTGANPLYVKGSDAPQSLGHFINFACGVTDQCDANCRVVFDDVKVNGHRRAWVTTTKDLPPDVWLGLDYNYRYDEAVDGDDPTMGWMKGLRC
jgi:hypothetical protein